MEMIPVKKQALVGSIMNTVDGFTLIYLAVYFRWISIHWLYYEIFGFSIICAALLLFAPLPESPKFLYSHQKYDRARQVLKTIAKINRVKEYDENYIFDTEYAQIKPLIIFKNSIIETQ